MTALQLMFFASVLGAVLFFVAGVVTMSLRRPRTVPRVHDQSAALAEIERELARTRHAAADQVQQLTAVAERHAAEAAALRAQLARGEQPFGETGTSEVTAPRAKVDAHLRELGELRELRARVERVERERRELRARAERAEAEVHELRSRVGRPPESRRVRAIDERGDREQRELRARLARAEQEARDLRTRAERAEGQARDARGQLARVEADNREVRTRAERAEADNREVRTRAERAEAEAAAATSKATQLAQELERTRSDAMAVTQDGEQLRARASELEAQLAERAQAARDLVTENEQLKGRLRDAEALRAEYVRLRTATVESRYLKSEIARLEEEVRALRVDALGGKPAAPARAPRATGPQTPPRDPGDAQRTISESLLGVLERFAVSATRSLAVADTAGFPLAATGDDAQALAAYAALVAESGTRAHQFLPFARPISMEIIDDRGAHVTVWPFDIAGDRLLLASLAVEPVEQARIDATLASLSAILAPSGAVSRSA